MSRYKLELEKKLIVCRWIRTNLNQRRSFIQAVRSGNCTLSPRAAKSDKMKLKDNVSELEKMKVSKIVFRLYS